MEFVNENLIYFAVILVPVLIFLFSFSINMKKRLLQKFGDIGLITKFSDNISFKRYRQKSALIIVAVFLTFIALARPQWGAKLQKIARRGLNIIVMVDVSKSMLAQDMVPSRLEKAKHEIDNLIDDLKGDRIGIIIFAGVPFLQCPLTIDYSAAKMYLDVVDTSSIPVPGTDIGAAIKLAIKSFPEHSKKYKVAILMTDGEDHGGDAMKMAEEAKKDNIVIYTIGMGTPSGELIPIRGENGTVLGYKKDKSGNPILSKLDEVTLEKIALITGGKYYRATSGELELKKVYSDILKMEREKIYGKQFTQKEDRFQWLLLPTLILFLWEVMLKERNKV